MAMSVFHQNLERKPAKIGMGLFAKVEMPKDTIIFEFRGNIMSANQIPSPLPPEEDRYLQIGKNKYLGPSGDLDDYINHSCTPNCGIFIGISRAFLKSIMLIPAGNEITFDYSSTSSETKEEWLLKCKCGAFNCRKEISGFQYLDDKTKNYYKALGVVPNYLMDK
jgi:SET domain-containing protein